MANNRDSSKQKRARQNRAQREAREARAKAAALPASERQAKYATSAPSGSTTDAAPRKKGLFGGGGSSADRPARAPRPGDVPVDVDTLEGNWYTIRAKVPGGRQALSGFGLMVVVTIMGVFVKLPAVKATKDQAALPAETIVSRFGPRAYLMMLIPLALAFVGAQFALHPRRRQFWLWAAAVSFAVSLVGLSWYMFPAGFFGFAVYKARKVEGPAPNSRAGRAAARARAEAEASDDVEVDVEVGLEGSGDTDTSAEGVAERRDADR